MFGQDDYIKTNNLCVTKNLSERKKQKENANGNINF